MNQVYNLNDLNRLAPSLASATNNTSSATNGSYWRGADGNVWVSGSNGTNSAGAWDPNSQNYWDSQGFNLVADPSNNPSVLGASTTGTNTLNTNNTTTPATNPNQTLIDLINGSLSRLPGQLDTAKSNIQNQYNTNNNQLQSQFDTAKQQYDTSGIQNQQSLRTNKNQIADKASMDMSSLMRLLGAHGAGGSSDAQFVLPQAVAGQASQERSGAMQNFAQNQQGLDTNWNGFNNGFQNSKKQLSDWLGQNLNQAQATNDQTQMGLQQQLLGLQPSVAAAQPYVDKINSLATDVNNLAKFNPTYDGKTPTYTPQALSTYALQANGGIQQKNSALDSAVSPYLSLLLGQNKKDQPLSF